MFISFCSIVNNFSIKKIKAYAASKKKVPPIPLKVDKEITKASTIDNAFDPVATVTKIPIPIRKRSHNIAGLSNKRARIEGLNSITFLAAEKKKRVVFSNEDVDLHISCWQLKKSQCVQDL